ncbi:hypothetical protein [Massilia sp. CF038]|uniref:hypothetical protein n=1 Tax=Massilia sp. CF038 TaxID=1881045 RepID=UPI0009193D4A|nr:hypothetical protein [Massilia sp. CF038]SHH71719.1 hypothetical protein SAMN05428948_5083 [Massilia sp. CF038]
MNRDSDDKLDTQDPARRHIQPPIPTHSPDPLAHGDADKIIGPGKQAQDPHQPPVVNTAIGSGPVIDPVGGPGLGQAPGGDGKETPATTRDRATRADDAQDRTGRP